MLSVHRASPDHDARRISEGDKKVMKYATQRQVELLAIIYWHKTSTGAEPTLSQIASKMGVTGNAVRDILLYLCKKNLIQTGTQPAVPYEIAKLIPCGQIRSPFERDKSKISIEDALVFAAIVKLHKQNGELPTFGQVAKSLTVDRPVSTGTVGRAVIRLARKGYLKRVNATRRSIEILSDGFAILGQPAKIIQPYQRGATS
jgi:Mn-dependent DtxR family transcriptional regulator